MAQYVGIRKNFPKVNYADKASWPEDWDAFDKEQNEALSALYNQGIVLQFPVADGRALYFVESEKPLQLSLIPFGDCYEIPEAYLRGINLSDVRAQQKMMGAFRC